MVKLLRDLGRKFVKGLNIAQHGKDLIGLKDQLVCSFVILLIGTIISTVLFVAGLWEKVGEFLSLPLYASPTSLSIHEYIISFVSILSISELAHHLFSVKSQGTKCVAWEYVYRYFKGFGLAILMFIPAIFAARMGQIYLSDYFVYYGAQSKSLLVIGCLVALVIASVLLGGLVFYLLRLALIFSTFTLALIMQGRPVVDAVVKGTKLFNAYWAYVAGLMTIFMVFATSIEQIFAFFFGMFPSVLIDDVRGILLSALLLLYCALFFSYHKRVSKVSPSR